MLYKEASFVSVFAIACRMVRVLLRVLLMFSLKYAK
jgi:hypothetical protein